MVLKRLRETQERLAWPSDSNDLPVISWDSCTFFHSPSYFPFLTLHSPLVQEQATKRPLILISGFIHDVSTFIDEHPGGRHFITRNIGKDATTAFFGGVYDHSNAAHVSTFLSLLLLPNSLIPCSQNLLAMKRVGVLSGGVPHISDDKLIPPSQRLKIARYSEINASSTDGEGMLG